MTSVGPSPSPEAPAEPGDGIDHIHLVDGLRIRYRIVEAAPSPPAGSVRGEARPADAGPSRAAPRTVLLLHGLGASVELWGPVYAWLSDVRVVALDVPGTGRSDVPPAGWAMSRYADLVARVLDHVGSGPVDVVGLSFGGMLAQELAHRHPRKVRTLTLVATSCGWGSVPGSPVATAAIATPLRYYSSTFLKLVAPLLYGGTVGSGGGGLQIDKRLAHPPPVRGYLGQLLAVWTWSSLPFLRRLRMPALVVAGTADPVIPVPNAWLLRAALPRASMHIVRGGGHLCVLDAPHQVMPAVRNFLADNGGLGPESNGVVA